MSLNPVSVKRAGVAGWVLWGIRDLVQHGQDVECVACSRSWWETVPEWVRVP